LLNWGDIIKDSNHLLVPVVEFIISGGIIHWNINVRHSSMQILVVDLVKGPLYHWLQLTDWSGYDVSNYRRVVTCRILIHSIV
jgi:hypothetical protein